MIYSAERKICIRGGTASAVTNNVAVNVSKHQRPPHGFAVIDRETVHVVQAQAAATAGTENAADAACSAAADDQQHCLDVKADVTQVMCLAPGADRGHGGRYIKEQINPSGVVIRRQRPTGPSWPRVGVVGAFQIHERVTAFTSPPPSLLSLLGIYHIDNRYGKVEILMVSTNEKNCLLPLSLKDFERVPDKIHFFLFECSLIEKLLSTRLYNK